jgi:hypothetical protein
MRQSLRGVGTGRHGGWPPRKCPAVSGAGPAGLALRAGHDHARLTCTRPWPAAVTVPSTASGGAPHQLPYPRWLPQGSPDVRANGRRAGGGQTPVRARGPPRTPAWPRVLDTACPDGGWRSFRKQRTVNPLIAPARYKFLYSASRPALRPGNDTRATGDRPHLPHQGKPQTVATVPRTGGWADEEPMAVAWGDGRMRVGQDGAHAQGALAGRLIALCRWA